MISPTVVMEYLKNEGWVQLDDEATQNFTQWASPCGCFYVRVLEEGTQKYSDYNHRMKETLAEIANAEGMRIWEVMENKIIAKE